MTEFISIAKAIKQTLEECISKIESIDQQVQKLKDVYENIKWKEFQTKIRSRPFIDEIEALNMRKADTLYELNQVFVDVIGFFEEEKEDIEEKPTKKQPLNQKKPETKEQPKQETTKEQTKPKDEPKKPEPTTDYEYYDEEESEASDFDEKEKQAKEAQQKKSEPKKQPEPELKKEPEPTLTQIQQKNEVFFQDVMRVLTDFTTKLESMLREHLDIKKKEANPEPKKDESTSESEQKTMSSIDDSSIDDDN